MAYALSAGTAKQRPVKSVLTALPPEAETIAELRELYRAAEARAARLRLLSTVGQELALARPAAIDETLQCCAQSLALFLGSTSGSISRSEAATAIPIHSPGPDGAPLAWIAISGCPSLDAIADAEDRQTARMCLDLVGATIDRVERESERAELFAALSEREQRLELLVGRIFSAQEEERRRVSQELHDGVAQTATALARMLEGSGANMEKGLPPEERGQLAGIARDLLKELRAVIAGLRPTLLDDLGLAEALRALGDSLSADGFSVAVLLEPNAARIPAHIETAVFRVAQEAVSNIRKHSGGPCEVVIELRRGEAGDRFLRICDDGLGVRSDMVGSITSGDGNHIGIEVMHERMAAIGGRLEWQPGPSGGVCVKALLPEYSRL